MRFKIRLAGFLAKSGMKKGELAVVLGISPQTISGWFNENRKPQLAIAKRLVEFTNGYITLKDCGHDNI